ncbi:MAG: carbon monoxide dehydrogenase subunit G [Azonexus sp.]|jgi:carbon monoxide dehydrogenase subunit G|nr:carbon monoxide dehydrogenase subunit G [Azonexus sp.]
MYIERTFIVDSPLQRTWDFLNEPEKVGACLPGCHTVEVVGPGKYKATVGLKVGPIKAGFNVEVETIEQTPPVYSVYTMRGDDKDGGSKVSAESTVSLKDIDGVRTEITYASKVQIVGKLGKFAGGVMDKFADSINAKFIAALTERIKVVEAADTAEAESSTGILGSVKSFFKKKKPAETAPCAAEQS